MAQNDTASIKLVIDAHEYLANLRKTSKMTQKEYEIMLKGFIKSEDEKAKTRAKNEREQKKRLARETARVKKASATQTKDRLESFKKFGEAAQGSIGAATGRIFALGEGITKLASTAGPFGIAAIAVAAIGTAGVLAFAAVGAAVLKASHMLHDFLLNAEETRKELEPLYKMGALKVVSKEQVDALRNYSANWSAVKTVIADLSVAIGGNLAKDLEGFSFEVLTLSIHVSDMLKLWLKGNSLIGENLKHLADERIKQVTEAIKLLLIPVLGTVKLFELVGIVAKGSASQIVKEMDKAANSLKKFTHTKIDEFVESGAEAFAKLTPSLEQARIKATLLKNDMIALKIAEDNAAASAKATAESQKQAAKAAEDRRKTIEAVQKEIGAFYDGVAKDSASLSSALKSIASAAAQSVMSPIEQINAKAKQELAKLDSTTQSLQQKVESLERGVRMGESQGVNTGLLQAQLDTAKEALGESEQARLDIVKSASDKVREIRQKEHDEHMKQLQEQADAQQKAIQQTVKTVFSGVDSLGKFAEMQAANAEEGSAAQRRAAMAAYTINKASSIAQITFATAVAIMEALKIPPPFGPIQAAAVGATGAVQMAAVVSQPPPSFHMGGAISSSTSAPDEVTIRARSGEGVLTPAGMRAIGGAEGLNRVNRGSSPQEITVVQRYQHRTLNAVLEDSVRMTNSPIRRAIKGKKKAGHRG